MIFKSNSFSNIECWSDLIRAPRLFPSNLTNLFCWSMLTMRSYHTNGFRSNLWSNNQFSSGNWETER